MKISFIYTLSEFCDSQTLLRESIEMRGWCHLLVLSSAKFTSFHFKKKKALLQTLNIALSKNECNGKYLF